MSILFGMIFVIGSSVLLYWGHRHFLSPSESKRLEIHGMILRIDRLSGQIRKLEDRLEEKRNELDDVRDELSSLVKK